MSKIAELLALASNNAGYVNNPVAVIAQATPYRAPWYYTVQNNPGQIGSYLSPLKNSVLPLS